MNEPPLTVNESILLLKADVKVLQQGQDRNYKDLKESQDKFHIEMKESFIELKDDYAIRLSSAEVKIDSLATWRNSLAVGVLFIGVIMALISYIYTSQQSIQDSRIDNLIKQVNHINP